MKKIIATAALLGCSAFASTSFGAEPTRDRAAEANEVAAALGLSDGNFRILSESESVDVRGTGGYRYGYGGLGLLNLGVTANVRANLNVLGLLGVNARVNARVGVR